MHTSGPKSMMAPVRWPKRPDPSHGHRCCVPSPALPHIFTQAVMPRRRGWHYGARGGQQEPSGQGHVARTITIITVLAMLVGGNSALPSGPPSTPPPWPASSAIHGLS